VINAKGRKSILIGHLRTSKWPCYKCGFHNAHSTIICILCAASIVQEDHPVQDLLPSNESSLTQIASLPKDQKFIPGGVVDITHVRSATAAAKDKETAGEKRNVEHVADLDLTAGGQTVDWTDLDGNRNGRVKRRNKKDFRIASALAKEKERAEINLMDGKDAAGTGERDGAANTILMEGDKFKGAGKMIQILRGRKARRRKSDANLDGPGEGKKKQRRKKGKRRC